MQAPPGGLDLRDESMTGTLPEYEHTFGPFAANFARARMAPRGPFSEPSRHGR